MKNQAQLRDEYQFFHWHLVFPDVFHPQPVAGDEGDETTKSP